MWWTPRFRSRSPYQQSLPLVTMYWRSERTVPNEETEGRESLNCELSFLFSHTSFFPFFFFFFFTFLLTAEIDLDFEQLVTIFPEIRLQEPNNTP